MKDLQGRTALVTGGSRGLGSACCRLLAEAGVNVAVNYRANEKKAAEVAKQVEKAGAQAHIVQADVSCPDQVKAMVEKITAALGPVELLINNAGIFDIATHDQVTLELWQRTLDVNLTSCYLVTWAVKDAMIERGYGRIVNLSSIAGIRARPLSIPYAVSKAGVIALTKGLAQAVADKNIRVNAIAPGLIETDMVAGLDKAIADKLVEDTPIKRMGKPEEIAKTAIFLLSEQSSFMTGQTIVVSGGRVLLP